MIPELEGPPEAGSLKWQGLALDGVVLFSRQTAMRMQRQPIGKAAQLSPDDAEIWSALGEALVLAANQTVSDEAFRRFQQGDRPRPQGSAGALLSWAKQNRREAILAPRLRIGWRLSRTALPTPRGCRQFGRKLPRLAAKTKIDVTDRLEALSAAAAACRAPQPRIEFASAHRHHRRYAPRGDQGRAGHSGTSQATDARIASHCDGTAWSAVRSGDRDLRARSRHSRADLIRIRAT